MGEASKQIVCTSHGLLVILLILTVTTSLGYSQESARNTNLEQPTHGLCEPITIPICKDIGYNQTFMPNILGHETQTDAGLEVTTYHPLVKINCSPQLSLFLCALYLPVCTILTTPIPPCRSVCIAARDGCSELMNRFGHDWPEYMACDKFPDSPSLCVGPNKSSSASSHNTNSDKSYIQNNIHTRTPRPLNPIIPYPVTQKNSVSNSKGQVDSSPTSNREIQDACPVTWAMEPKRKYQIIFSEERQLNNCGLPCTGVMFDAEQDNFARYWIGGWAILCFVSTLFTVLTFLIDMRRFRYPERPIIFISGCYLVISLCYVVGFVLKDTAACITADGGAAVVTQGTKNEGCTILFMLTYFFTMSSSIWWVILTLTWVLAAGLKWGHEAIESNSQYFHLAAWGVPAIKTITIIALGSIDGDVLSGM